MSARLRIAPWLLLAAISACVQGEPPAGPVAWSVKDSSGIAVVENRLDRVPSGVWSLEAAPLLSIGGLDAPASHQLYRVSGATRLPDGRIAVSSAGTFDVGVYGPQGDLLATFGSEGDGPGEFRDPVLVGRRGADTVVVFDATLSRLSWIHPAEGFLASVPVSWSGTGYPLGRGLLADGPLLVGGGRSDTTIRGER